MTGGNVTNIQPNLINTNQVSVKDGEKTTGFLDVMNKTVDDSLDFANASKNKTYEVDASSKNLNDEYSSRSEVVEDNETVSGKESKLVDDSDSTNKIDDVKDSNAVKKENSVEESENIVLEDEATIKADVSLDIVEAINATIGDFEAKVKEILTESLDISEDEIEEAMQNLGITYADLVNPKYVTNLMVEVTGVTESVSIVLDENISNALSQINECAKAFFEEAGINSQDLKTITSKESAFLDILSDMEIVEPTPIDDETLDVNKSVNVQEFKLNLNDEVQNTNYIDNVSENVGKEVSTTKVFNDTSKINSEVVDEDVDVLNEVVKASTEEFASNNDSNNSLSQEPRKQFEGQNVQFNQVIGETQQINESLKSEAKPLSRYQAVEMINQISEQARVTISKEVTDLEMILNPESLGKIYLHVSEKQGAMKAQITAQNEFVKEALENQMALLKDNLNKAGIKVEAVEVSVGTHEFEKNLEENMHGQERQGEQMEEHESKMRRNRSIDLNNLDELQGLMTDEEMLVAQMMKDQGNSVNYMV